MKKIFNICMASVAFIILLACLAEGAYLTTSTSGDLIFEAIEGHGSTSNQEFGLGTPDINSTIDERNVIFTIHLLNENIDYVTPSSIVNMGYFPAGSELDFYNLSDYAGSYWAFSSGLDSTPTPSDLVTFTDSDNSLGLGGTAIETVGVDSWILHLDDAASICCDDDDNEMVIKVYVNSTVVPEPVSSILFIVGGVSLAVRRYIKKRKRHNMTLL